MDTIASFDRAAESYATFAAPQAALAYALASWIAPAERRGRAVEFGAGTGLLTECLQPWTGNYLSTDASAAMLRRGEARCPSVHWQLRDARTPAGLGPADWIFSCGLLQWLDRPEITLRRWHTEMAPGGQLAVGILLPGTFAELESLLPGASPVRWRSIPEWENLLLQAGFRLDRTESWQHLSQHASALEFLRSVHAMGLAPRRAVGPGRLRAALRAYDRHFAGPNGVRATWHAWLALATAI